MVTPREKRHDLTRQKIMDTALDLIATDGLDNFSLRQLAARSDYSPAALYKYFASKDDILDAIRAEFWQRSRQASPETPDQTPPERLIASGKAYLAFAEAYPQHYLLVFNAGPLEAGGFSDLYQDPRFSPLIAIVRDGVERGYFRLPEGYTPESMAIHLWVSVHGIVMLRFTILKEHREEFTRLAETTMTAFVHSFTVKSSS